MERGSSLTDVLMFRDKKAEIQRKFLKQGKKACVLSFGLNVPGPDKTGERIRSAFLEEQQCVETLLRDNGWSVLKWEELDEKAGYAVICLTDADPYLLKKAAADLEEYHMLGRLFDIDVIDPDGAAVTREQIGRPVRKCLLCEEAAKVCSRSRRHSVDELYEKVIQMIENWSDNSDSERDTF